MSLFSLRLQCLRKEKGETQQTLCDLLKVQRSTYSSYENGVIVPPFEKIQKLADHFAVSVSYLMGRENSRDYTVQKSNIPNILEQLQIIVDELKDETVLVTANDYKLTNEDKEQVTPFIICCLNMIKSFEIKGSKCHGKY